MPEQKKYYPSEKNLGQPCMFWNFKEGRYVGCNYPKLEMEGRTSCEGIIDPVCIYLLDRKILPGLPAQLLEDKSKLPKIGQKPEIPSSDNLDITNIQETE